MSSLCAVIMLDVLETGVTATLLLTWRERFKFIWPEFNTNHLVLCSLSLGVVNPFFTPTLRARKGDAEKRNGMR